MAINKKLIHFKNKENFEREVANENILDTSICFILDSKEISTHGTVYKTVNWSVLEDPFNGHDYVDLGLPSGTLWATSVIGGDNPLYFQWGDIEGWTTEQVENGEKAFDFEGLDYKFGEYTYTKYDFEDGKTVLDPEDDAAHVHMGGDWHMPTKEQYEELTANTTSTWTTQNGVNGRLFTASNGKSVFVPAFGHASEYYYGGLGDVGSGGYVWSSSVDDANFFYGYALDCNSSKVYVSIDDRTCGLCVLGVINPKS